MHAGDEPAGPVAGGLDDDGLVDAAHLPRLLRLARAAEAVGVGRGGHVARAAAESALDHHELLHVDLLSASLRVVADLVHEALGGFGGARAERRLRDVVVLPHLFESTELVVGELMGEVVLVHHLPEPASPRRIVEGRHRGGVHVVGNRRDVQVVRVVGGSPDEPVRILADPHVAVDVVRVLDLRVPGPGHLHPVGVANGVVVVLLHQDIYRGTALVELSLDLGRVGSVAHADTDPAARVATAADRGEDRRALDRRSGRGVRPSLQRDVPACVVREGRGHGFGGSGTVPDPVVRTHVAVVRARRIGKDGEIAAVEVVGCRAAGRVEAPPRRRRLGQQARPRTHRHDDATDLPLARVVLQEERLLRSHPDHRLRHAAEATELARPAGGIVAGVVHGICIRVGGRVGGRRVLRRDPVGTRHHEQRERDPWDRAAVGVREDRPSADRAGGFTEASDAISLRVTEPYLGERRVGRHVHRIDVAVAVQVEGVEAERTRLL